MLEVSLSSTKKVLSPLKETITKKIQVIKEMKNTAKTSWNLHWYLSQAKTKLSKLNINKNI